MYRLLSYLSCCLILVAGTSLLPNDSVEDITSIPEEEEFPVVTDTWSNLGLPSPEEQAVMDEQKINWLPVWQVPDLRESSERKARSAEEENVKSSTVATSQVVDTSAAAPKQPQLASTTPRVAASIVKKESTSPVKVTETVSSSTTESVSLSPRDGNTQSCPSSSERGLTRLIRSARPLLPADHLRNIIANAVHSDTQVQNLVQLLRSDKFKQDVQILRATKQFKSLQDYLCQRLKLNYDYYIDYVKVFLNVYTNEKPSSSLPNSLPGIRGLLQDLRNALPRNLLRDLYQRLYSSDRELSESVRLIRGREFRNVLREVRNTKEYIAVREQLRKANVPLQQVSSLVATALGWSNVDIGEEIVLVNL